MKEFLAEEALVDQLMHGQAKTTSKHLAKPGALGPTSRQNAQRGRPSERGVAGATDDPY